MIFNIVSAIVAYLVFGLMCTLFLYYVVIHPKPVDVMDKWVADRLSGPAPIPNRWPGADVPAVESDSDGVFDQAYIRSGLCQCDECQAMVDEDYPI